MEFVPLSVRAAPAAAGGAFEIVLRNGRVLRVGAACDDVAVAKLAAALEGGGPC